MMGWFTLNVSSCASSRVQCACTPVCVVLFLYAICKVHSLVFLLRHARFYDPDQAPSRLPRPGQAILLYLHVDNSDMVSGQGSQGAPG